MTEENEEGENISVIVVFIVSISLGPRFVTFIKYIAGVPGMMTPGGPFLFTDTSARTITVSFSVLTLLAWLMSMTKGTEALMVFDTCLVLDGMVAVAVILSTGVLDGAGGRVGLYMKLPEGIPQLAPVISGTHAHVIVIPTKVSRSVT